MASVSQGRRMFPRETNGLWSLESEPVGDSLRSYCWIRPCRLERVDSAFLVQRHTIMRPMIQPPAQYQSDYEQQPEQVTDRELEPAAVECGDHGMIGKDLVEIL